jgi:glycosyltransferase involved in cell wall biosynthesis
LARPFYFAKYLIKSGNNVRIFAASTVHNSDINLITSKTKFREERIDDIKYVYLKSSNYTGNGINRIINMFQYTIGLFNISGEFTKPDVIIATSVHPLACVAGIKIAKKYKCKCIVEIADLWPLSLIDLGIIEENSVIAKILYVLEHWIYKKADNIVFTMEGGKEYIADKYKNYKIEPSKICYINNGVDLKEYYRQLSDNIYMDKDLDDIGTFKILYTGSLGMANAPIYIVRAAKIIKEKGYNDIKFIIFGSGYLKEELELYCKQNELNNVFFKGKVDKKYIPNILSKSDLNIFTGEQINLYRYGLSLNKMFDYIASGKPTVSNIKCGYDNLEKYNCGITVKGGSAAAIAEGILKIYNMTDEEYNEICKNAMTAAEHFDFKNLTSMMISVINDTGKMVIGEDKK